MGGSLSSETCCSSSSACCAKRDSNFTIEVAQTVKADPDEDAGSMKVSHAEASNKFAEDGAKGGQASQPDADPEEKDDDQEKIRMKKVYEDGSTYEGQVMAGMRH